MYRGDGILDGSPLELARRGGEKPEDLPELLAPGVQCFDEVLNNPVV